MTAEARIAARFGFSVRAGGGTAQGAEQAALDLVAAGATALVSFGLAGGLDPALGAGSVMLPSFVRLGVLSGDLLMGADRALAQWFGGLTGHVILAGSEIVADAATKRRLHTTTQAHAVDLESGAVARVAEAHALPFIVIRAICDPAQRDLPPAALLALNPNGAIGFRHVLRSVVAKPSQIPDLLALARDAAQARRALIRLAKRFHAGDPCNAVRERV